MEGGIAMRTLRNIITILSLAGALQVSAQLQYFPIASDFRSTSTMTEIGSRYSATPSLNADGTAMYNTPSYPGSSSGIRKAPPGTGGDKPNPDIEGPIGDALIPLLLIALGYVIYRRKRHIPE